MNPIIKLDSNEAVELEQQQRTILRGRFLDVVESMEASKQIEIATYEGATVTGKFRSIDYDISNVHVSSLSTPIGCIPEALVRTSDILAIKFEMEIK